LKTVGKTQASLRCVALRCVALRCVALRCVALRCVALRCVALRYVTFGTLEVSQEKEKFSRFHNQKTLLFVLSYTFFSALQLLLWSKDQYYFVLGINLIISELYSYKYKLVNPSDQ